MCDGAKSQHCRGRQQLHRNKQCDGERSYEPEINPPHSRVEMASPAIAIDAGFERQKPIDRAKMQTCVSDKNEISCSVDREPGGEDIAGPEMHKSRNHLDLLRNPQCHLQTI